MLKDLYGKTFDNLVFRPMLRAPSDTDGTYTPFVKQDVYNITFQMLI